MLGICRLLFEHLNSHEIRYCHWKSNSHLDHALNGKTDLDILIWTDDRKQFEQVCKNLAFKNILSPPEKQFPGLDDYLGFDHETGRLIHLHVHYRLILGQKYIKNHHLPIESIVFQNLGSKDGVAIPCPEMELILLIIRAHLKLDAVSLLKHAIRDLQGRHYTPFPSDIEAEMTALITAYDPDKFEDIFSQCNLPIPITSFTSFIRKISEKGYTCADAIRKKRLIASSLKKFRRQKGISLFLRYAYLSFLNSRGLRIFINQQKKRLVGDGKIFSLVGADGAGKSSLVIDLERWLSWKLSVKRYYYGIPKNNFINLVDYVIRAARKFNLDVFATFVENCLWVLVARLRYKVFLSSQKEKSRGTVILTDRFPLKEFRNMETPMDGPRLRKRSTIIGRSFAQLESCYYDKINSPDRVFVLQVGADELRSRKTDLDISAHETKAAAVNAIQGNDYIRLLDANKSYPNVLLEIKRKIWESL